MVRVDFSDIQKNGYRINQFRLAHSISSRKYSSSKKEYKSSGNLIGERIIVINHLIEQNEIDFTIYWFSVRLMYFFIATTLLLMVFYITVIVLPIISAVLSISLYLIANRYKENFILGNIGINFAESIYNL
jgi:hypothetical protein